MRRHRKAEHFGHVGDALGFEEAAAIAQIRMQNIAALVENEVLEAVPSCEIFTGTDGDTGGRDQALPTLGVIRAIGSSKPHGLDGFDCLGQLDRGAEVELPVAVNHQVMIEADRLAAVLPALPNAGQFGGG